MYLKKCAKRKIKITRGNKGNREVTQHGRGNRKNIIKRQKTTDSSDLVHT